VTCPSSSGEEVVEAAAAADAPRLFKTGFEEATPVEEEEEEADSLAPERLRPDISRLAESSLLSAAEEWW
jgi:hypothetical protein